MFYTIKKFAQAQKEWVLRASIVQRLKEAILIALLFLTLVYLFQLYPPEATDWHFAFYPVAQAPFDPYATQIFINPPWLALFLYPFKFFPESIGLAINSVLGLMMIALLVIRRGGSKTALILTLTSLPVLTTLASGTIEWLVVIAFLLRSEWSVPLLLLKPQVGILAVLSWDSFRQKGALFILLGALTLVLSFLLWGNWLPDLFGNIRYLEGLDMNLASWNVSIFPWSIPVGLGLIYWMFRPTVHAADAEIMGVVATLCLVPYFALYTLSLLFALISTRHKKAAIAIWLFLWVWKLRQVFI